MGPSLESSERVLDCSIYVDSEDRESVLQSIAQSVDGKIEPFGILEAPALRIYAAHNDYESGLVNSSNFIEWPSVLECEPMPGVDAETFVSAIGVALMALWDAAFRAIAACDFEDRLPHSGGIHLFD